MFYNSRRTTSDPYPRGRSFDINAESRESSALTVSELVGLVRQTLASNFSFVSVVGEISELSVPGSGHAYFALKDASSKLSAVMWSSNFRRLPFKLSVGLKVVCSGRVDVYAPQGKYQLIATSVEPVGIGPLELAFQQLQDKLRREGLFDASRKKRLPRFIKRVGVVTSVTSAAFRDFLNILERRAKRIDAIVAPVRVQGEGADREIVDALLRLDRYRDRLGLDAVALIRGGGSVEDLWTFNEERVARAIVSMNLPVVTGIGHEVDVSISDLAADVHALTPSDAAARLSAVDDRTLLATLDDRESRLNRAIEFRLARAKDRLDRLEEKLTANDPREVYVSRMEAKLEDLERRLDRGIAAIVEEADRKTIAAAARLVALNPLAVLARGYALVRRADDGSIVREPNEVSPGDEIETSLAKGKIRSIVV